jgi:hypothetical protein
MSNIFLPFVSYFSPPNVNSDFSLKFFVIVSKEKKMGNV